MPKFAYINNSFVNFKNANVEIKFWREKDNKFISKKLIINDNGSYWFELNKEKKVKNFLKNKSGWITIAHAIRSMTPAAAPRVNSTLSLCLPTASESCAPRRSRVRCSRSRRRGKPIAEITIRKYAY